MHTKEEMKKLCTYCNQNTSNLEYHIKIYHYNEEVKNMGLATSFEKGATLAPMETEGCWTQPSTSQRIPTPVRWRKVPIADDKKPPSVHQGKLSLHGWRNGHRHLLTSGQPHSPVGGHHYLLVNGYEHSPGSRYHDLPSWPPHTLING